MVGVQLKNIVKKYGHVVAVDNVSIEIEDRSFVVLLGPSGCGKTTTLRCIAGLETPDEGEIYIGDVLVNDLSPKERDIAMVFQSYALYPHMKVSENIAFPLRMHKTYSKNEIRNKVKETAELLKIDHLLDRKPRQLSGGEAQRVAVGRAIVRDPKVFLMDEPLSNLDSKLRIYMRAELKRLQKDLEVTTIYVTHDQTEAMTMADKIVVMNGGKVQQVGKSYEIFSHPANQFVAGFIGSPPINFFACTFAEKNCSYFLNTATFPLQLPDDLGALIKKQATSSELVLGVRPEDISIKKNKTADYLIEANVYVIEPLGSESIVDLETGDTIFKVKTSTDLSMDIGEKVWVQFLKEKLLIFDGKTGNAIA